MATFAQMKTSAPGKTAAKAPAKSKAAAPKKNDTLSQGFTGLGSAKAPAKKKGS